MNNLSSPPPRRNALDEIEAMIALLARLPGLGPRSARRAALALIDKREALLEPLADAMAEAARKVRACEECGNLGTGPLCAICLDPNRDARAICVVEQVADLWALERAGAHRGRYHVLGGALSALAGMDPDKLRIPQLTARAKDEAVSEVILALNATIDGRTTAHYIADALKGCGVRISTPAQGVPIGGELDYLDEGTIAAALAARREF